MPESDYRVREKKKQEQHADNRDGKECPQCLHINDAEAAFCEECGAGFDAPEKPCPVCGEMNSGIYCAFCGTNTEGHFCRSCGKIQYGDFCPDCGEPLTEMLQKLEEAAEEPAQERELSEQEASEIIQDIEDSLTPAMVKELEKKRQRIILLQEREYFNEREKRIEHYNASLTGKVKIISPEQMAEIKKTVERLRSLVAEEEKRVDEIIEAREEQARQEEAERLRIEEERKARQAHYERIDGIWISTETTWIETMKLTLSAGKLSGSSHWKAWDGGKTRECVFTLKGTWDGNRFSFRSTGIRNITGSSGHFTFCGTANDSGTILNGYFIDYSKEKKQQIFCKQ